MSTFQIVDIRIRELISFYCWFSLHSDPTYKQSFEKIFLHFANQ